MKEIFVDVVGTGWFLFLFFAILDVFNGFKITVRVFFRWRDILWTFRYRGEPITVHFYDSVASGLPFQAFVWGRRDADLVFETSLRDLRGVYGRLSVSFATYGTTWCWGHEGEEVEALAVSRALA